jgi:hypothetical protein
MPKQTYTCIPKQIYLGNAFLAQFTKPLKRYLIRIQTQYSLFTTAIQSFMSHFTVLQPCKWLHNS